MPTAVVVAACADARQVAEAEFDPASNGYFTVATALPSPGFWEGDTETASGLTGGFEWAIASALAERFDLE